MSTDKWCFKQTANLLSLGTHVFRHVVRSSFARSSELVRGIVAKLTRVILHPDTCVWVKYHAKFGFMILPSITMEVAFQLYSFHCLASNMAAVGARALRLVAAASKRSKERAFCSLPILCCRSRLAPANCRNYVSATLF